MRTSFLRSAPYAMARRSGPSCTEQSSRHLDGCTEAIRFPSTPTAGRAPPNIDAGPLRRPRGIAPEKPPALGSIRAAASPQRDRRPLPRDVRASAAPRARNLGAGAVLALQARIGNAAVGRVLARDPKKPDPPAKKDPLEGYRPAASPPLNLPKQWTNPHLLASVYPGRDAMFREFVVLYREIELGGSPTAAVRKKIREETDADERRRARRRGQARDGHDVRARVDQGPDLGLRRHALLAEPEDPGRAPRSAHDLLQPRPPDVPHPARDRRRTRARASEKQAADEQYARDKAEWDKKPGKTAAERRARGPAPASRRRRSSSPSWSGPGSRSATRTRWRASSRCARGRAACGSPTGRGTRSCG